MGFAATPIRGAIAHDKRAMTNHLLFQEINMVMIADVAAIIAAIAAVHAAFFALRAIRICSEVARSSRRRSSSFSN